MLVTLARIPKKIFSLNVALRKQGIAHRQRILPIIPREIPLLLRPHIQVNPQAVFLRTAHQRLGEIRARPKSRRKNSHRPERLRIQSEPKRNQSAHRRARHGSVFAVRQGPVFHIDARLHFPDQEIRIAIANAIPPRRITRVQIGRRLVFTHPGLAHVRFVVRNGHQDRLAHPPRLDFLQRRILREPAPKRSARTEHILPVMEIEHGIPFVPRVIARRKPNPHLPRGN